MCLKQHRAVRIREESHTSVRQSFGTPKAVLGLAATTSPRSFRSTDSDPTPDLLSQKLQFDRIPGHLKNVTGMSVSRDIVDDEK